MGKILILLVSLFLSLPIWAEDFSLDEELKKLVELKATGLISEEEYVFFYSSLTHQIEEQGLYVLTINKKMASDFYKVKDREGKYYFPFFSFFNLLEHTAIDKTTDEILIFLENNHDIVKINFLENKVIDRDKKTYEFRNEKEYFIEEDEIFFASELFEKLFLSALELNREELTIDVITNFMSREEQLLMLSINEQKAQSENEKTEVLYTNNRKFFELGYLRINSDLEKEEKNSYTWTGNLEYQGAFLFGKTTLEYDLHQKKIGNSSLRYTDIWNNHSLELWRYSNSEKGISFKKDTGYFWDGGQFIIHEEVPIGSTVELIYMDMVIDVKRAESGEVFFKNSEIRKDRNYTLKIYTPEGHIFLKEIYTARNYNHQLKNEIEYDINLREKKAENSYEGKAKIFYGISEQLTAGMEYFSSPEYLSTGKIETLKEIELELIYGNRVKNFPYTLEIGFGRVLNYPTQRDVYTLLGEIDIREWNFLGEIEKFGSYYNEKLTQNFKVTYDPNYFYTLGYEFLRQENYQNQNLLENKFFFSLNQTFDNFLASLNYNISSLTQTNEFDFNLYYRGFENYFIILNSSWKNFAEDFEAKLSCSTKNYYGPFDGFFEIKYSEKEKELLSFKFEIKLDDWFTVELGTNENGKNFFGVGVDRTFDLRDVRKPIENMDTSRVKAVTFLDENGNGVFDEGESKLEDVQISIGSQELLTDKNGEALFYGVPNKVKYNLIVESPHPMHTLGNVKYFITGRDSSTIEAIIPIQYYHDLNGTFKLAENLNLNEEEINLFFSDIIIELSNEEGKIVEAVSLDEIGDFTINGLLKKNYTLVVLYNGELFPPLKSTQKITLSDNPFTLIFDGKTIIFNEEVRWEE